MKNIKFLITLFILAATAGTNALRAQTLGEAELNQIKSSFIKDSKTKALQNILTADKNISNKTKNWEVNGKVDHFFKYKVNVKGITDQQSSGRCWMFTSMNAIRPLVIEKYSLKEFDFSHNYSYFWDILEKSNLFLESIIATAQKDMDDREVVTFFNSPVGDGGVWNLFYNIAEKYGVVPQSVMPESEHSNNTGQMIKIINERLRAGGYSIRTLAQNNSKNKTITITTSEGLVQLKDKEAIDSKTLEAMRVHKTEVLKDVYRVLALCLGEPPTEFTWRYKTKDGEIKTLTSTPKEFYKNILPADYNPQTYIMTMNDPTREYYKVYEIKNYRNTIEGINWVYLNLPNEELKTSALASIKDNEPMYASCDVGKQLDRENGILDINNFNAEALFGIDIKMDKKARILTRQSGSTHAMLLMACDTDENDIPVKWEFENSWGAASGNKGYLTLTDEWFSEYMFRLVINKKYLSTKALNSLTQKPIQLPVWDYMF